MIQVKSTYNREDAMKQGAFYTGTYPNFLAEIGLTDEEAREKVKRAFETIFFDPEEGFCHRTDEDAWCMVDTGNIDARTVRTLYAHEGRSQRRLLCLVGSAGRKA